MCNPALVDGFVSDRRRPISSGMPYCFGSTPTRGVSSYDIVARDHAVEMGLQ
jgi:hypothetical protein